jgi:phosphoglycolate phosphatase
VTSVRAIVFDWDQTLWDSWDLHHGAIAHAARSLGLPEPSADAIAGDIGASLEEYLNRTFPDPQAAREHYLAFYGERRTALGQLFPGVREVLEALRDRGHQLAVLSNKERAAGEWEMDAAGLGGLFAVAAFREDLPTLKPEPEGLWHVLARLGVATGDALYIGDSRVDVLCARRAGVASAAALWGARNAEGLLGAGPDLVWREPSDALGGLSVGRG